MLNNLWQSKKPAKSADYAKSVNDTVSKLMQAKNLVLLEGPPEVATSADQLWRGIALEFAAIAKVATDAPQDESLWKHDHTSYRDALEIRDNLKRDFIATAQNSLNEGFNSTPDD